jgi:hypothetical protein
MTSPMLRLRLLTRLGLTTPLLRLERWAANSDMSREKQARTVTRKQLATRQ